MYTRLQGEPTRAVFPKLGDLDYFSVCLRTQTQGNPLWKTLSQPGQPPLRRGPLQTPFPPAPLWLLPDTHPSPPAPESDIQSKLSQGAEAGADF